MPVILFHDTPVEVINSTLKVGWRFEVVGQLIQKAVQASVIAKLSEQGCGLNPGTVTCSTSV